MPLAPEGWRADDGYQYASSPPPPKPVMYFYPPPPLCVPGPLGVYNINVGLPPPPPKVEVKVECTPKSAKASEAPSKAKDAPMKEIKLPPPPPKKEEKEESKSKKTDEPKKKTNLCKPPSIPNGANYMFPAQDDHTQINIFRKAAKVWDPKYKGVKLGFKMFTVDTSKTVKSMIEHVRADVKSADVDLAEHCKGWAATEVLEGGSSTWFKGTTIEYTSDKAKGTLKSMGWDKKRGTDLPPVWICVHKV
ncbi:hypothetical protein Tdes44962_MAKER05694 [Teratosphaeria destructans]|uniref:Uncharacterized protein n=1 Tax=Teratosphaeria destructans TaxID=418781 RepID=A0A9W7SJ48_9PEZI|nr:hypothetical protein Tdes44962_MAKER05694 [Teratosphaeria destructans]